MEKYSYLNKNDKNLLKRFGESAYRNYSRRLDWQVSLRELASIYETIRIFILKQGRGHKLIQPKDYEVLCPHCGTLAEKSDCPDLFYLGISKQYEKQWLLQEEMQEAGFNLVTCGHCGDPFLHRT